MADLRPKQAGAQSERRRGIDYSRRFVGNRSLRHYGHANVYLGLRAGMTVSASIPAAVISLGILRGVLGRKSVLESNLVQTAASAGESLAAGIIFTMPALLLTGVWQHFDFWTTTLVALTGGLLGILLMIPMRQVFVVDNTELKFPEGVACAEVLRTAFTTMTMPRAAVDWRSSWAVLPSEASSSSCNRFWACFAVPRKPPCCGPDGYII